MTLTEVAPEEEYIKNSAKGRDRRNNTGTVLREKDGITLFVS
eukprot:CAMPEP_0204625666 /NCGR_PEP_ID=MMETSP0717-20131115/11389_1 /ASSEMBLY_ACC=CAM_ASM_000666 /TAXON_ID=230516 /ORGANISM="Chaetoceros curvisetus" /LENGTH=41 /DNA_ID= /DNA_START= /DNA_END= /DNA_ORIENTATION=